MRYLLACLDALDTDERATRPRQRGEDWPTTEPARQRLFDTIADVIPRPAAAARSRWSTGRTWYRLHAGRRRPRDPPRSRRNVDLAAAEAAGVDAAFIRRDHRADHALEHEPAHHVESLADLPGLVGVDERAASDDRGGTVNGRREVVFRS